MAAVRAYIDVDGVLNALEPNFLREGEWRQFKANGFPISIHSATIDFLRELEDRGVVMNWLTTWLGDAPIEISPHMDGVGENWDVVGKDAYHSSLSNWTWWKFLEMKNQRKLYPDDHFIWIDDDIRLESKGSSMLAHFLNEDGNITWLSPDTNRALTVREISAILESLGQAQSA